MRKKSFLMILIIFALALVTVSCTRKKEEKVEPQSQEKFSPALDLRKEPIKPRLKLNKNAFDQETLKRMLEQKPLKTESPALDTEKDDTEKDEPEKENGSDKKQQEETE